MKQNKNTNEIHPDEIEKVITILTFGSVMNITTILSVNPIKEKSHEYLFNFNFDSIQIIDNQGIPHDIIYEINKENKELFEQGKRRSLKHTKELCYLKRVKSHIHSLLREQRILDERAELFNLVTVSIWESLYKSTVEYLRLKAEQIDDPDYSQIVVSLEDGELKKNLKEFIQIHLQGKSGFDSHLFIQIYQL